MLLGILTLLGGCDTFAFMFADEVENPQEVLIGNWVIERVSSSYSVYDWSLYHWLEFLDDNTFTISYEDGTVFEQDTILSITDTSFEYRIDLMTLDPTIEGEQSYAEYEIRQRDGETLLRISLFDDANKGIQFCSFFAVKQ